jgi:hypothetical protein
MMEGKYRIAKSLGWGRKERRKRGRSWNAKATLVNDIFIMTSQLKQSSQAHE